MVDLQNISIHFTGENLFENVNLKINKNDRFALVGSNGSGKTTLLNIIAKNYSPSEGKVIFPKNFSIGFLQQEFYNSSNNDLFSEAKSAMKKIIFLEEEERIIHKQLESCKDDYQQNALLHQLSEIHLKKEMNDYFTHESRIEKTLMGMGFTESDFMRKVNEFSGGWRMRIELCKILLADHDLLIMDEPTNHLDIDSQEWLVNYLKDYKGALILVSHDRMFLNQLTDKTIEIYNKKLTVFNGNYSKYLELKIQRDEQLKAQQKNLERLIKEKEKFIERFRYKATKARQVQSRIKQLEKIDAIELQDFEKEISIRFPEPPQSGSIVLELESISKYYNDKLVFEDISLQLERNDKIAFVGPNGAGKSTLAKIIAKVIQQSSGNLKYGYNTIISYYSQEVANSLDLAKDIFDTIYDSNPDLTAGLVRSLLGAFLFHGDDVFKTVGVLSGGEKSRVALAKLMVEKANLIILDEPTNHLDYDSKLVLQKALQEFNGTLIIVAHDIEFLQPIVNKVFELRNNTGKLYYGGIDYYLKKRNEYSFEEIHNESLSEKSSKKNLKRIEAEQRQKKYQMTKELRKQLINSEELIDKLENEKLLIEKELTNPMIFSNPTLSKEKNLRYSTLKSELEAEFDKWAQISSHLENIEKQFSA